MASTTAVYCSKIRFGECMGVVKHFLTGGLYIGGGGGGGRERHNLDGKALLKIPFPSLKYTFLE